MNDKMKDDGGPAFPQPCNDPKGAHPEESWNAGFGGMTLRDYFAAKAMQGLIAQGYFTGFGVIAYEKADEMLEARRAKYSWMKPNDQLSLEHYGQDHIEHGCQLIDKARAAIAKYREGKKSP